MSVFHGQRTSDAQHHLLTLAFQRRDGLDEHLRLRQRAHAVEHHRVHIFKVAQRLALTNKHAVAGRGFNTKAQSQRWRKSQCGRRHTSKHRKGCAKCGVVITCNQAPQNEAEQCHSHRQRQQQSRTTGVLHRSETLTALHIHQPGLDSLPTSRVTSLLRTNLDLTFVNHRTGVHKRADLHVHWFVHIDQARAQHRTATHDLAVHRNDLPAVHLDVVTMVDF